MQDWLTILQQFFPSLGVAATTVLVLWLVNQWLHSSSGDGDFGSSTTFQFMRLLLLAFALVAIVLLLPISDQTQGQVLSLLGVVVTAVIALSATTFVANVMAGLMLQANNNIRPGDFIRVADQFGRVTRRSLLQTQIQTEWRDLATLPNLLLINNPVTVLHRDGTIISAELSLGYDIPYTRIESLLKQAAAEAGLEEPFVLVQELLDHAVSYRVAGFLPETKNLLTARSNLRKKSLEVLHGHAVEIVSPSFMVQRPIATGHKIIPEQPVRHQQPRQMSVAPEERIFDKAEEAANLEQSREQLELVKASIKELRASTRGADEATRADLDFQIEQITAKQHWLEASIERLQEN